MRLTNKINSINPLYGVRKKAYQRWGTWSANSPGSEPILADSLNPTGHGKQDRRSKCQPLSPNSQNKTGASLFLTGGLVTFAELLVVLSNPATTSRHCTYIEREKDRLVGKNLWLPDVAIIYAIAAFPETDSNDQCVLAILSHVRRTLTMTAVVSINS